ncbi:hypothetical protein HYH03_014725 [Edaphochlamys debaryana]|uniref:Uncharacterized protein n=1 Tax=Edaphochlamys debaryana TaxID=47281 RepID=A0A836BRY6_9CHLO|nr:hypothetical protein HYH03_014725 [Edaphochlamys debaryana]|eukprot:KAG2486670.1 hypothetical protein HYH03_014725 [Edaphochlamys debaryana]
MEPSLNPTGPAPGSQPYMAALSVEQVLLGSGAPDASAVAASQPPAVSAHGATPAGCPGRPGAAQASPARAGFARADSLLRCGSHMLRFPPPSPQPPRTPFLVYATPGAEAAAEAGAVGPVSLAPGSAVPAAPVSGGSHARNHLLHPFNDTWDLDATGAGLSSGNLLINMGTATSDTRTQRQYQYICQLSLDTSNPIQRTMTRPLQIPPSPVAELPAPGAEDGSWCPGPESAPAQDGERDSLPLRPSVEPAAATPAHTEGAQALEALAAAQLLEPLPEPSDTGGASYSGRQGLGPKPGPARALPLPAPAPAAQSCCGARPWASAPWDLDGDAWGPDCGALGNPWGSGGPQEAEPRDPVQSGHSRARYRTDVGYSDDAAGGGVMGAGLSLLGPVAPGYRSVGQLTAVSQPLPPTPAIWAGVACARGSSTSTSSADVKPRAQLLVGLEDIPTAPAEAEAEEAQSSAAGPGENLASLAVQPPAGAACSSLHASGQLPGRRRGLAWLLGACLGQPPGP